MDALLPAHPFAAIEHQTSHKTARGSRDVLHHSGAHSHRRRLVWISSSSRPGGQTGNRRQHRSKRSHPRARGRSPRQVRWLRILQKVPAELGLLTDILVGSLTTASMMVCSSRRYAYFCLVPHFILFLSMGPDQQMVSKRPWNWSPGLMLGAFCTIFRARPVGTGLGANFGGKIAENPK